MKKLRYQNGGNRSKAYVFAEKQKGEEVQPFEIEGENLRKYYAKNNPNVDVEIIPFYGEDEFNSARQKIGNFSEEDQVFLFGHSGNTLGGVPHTQIADSLKDGNLKTCYAGSCNFENYSDPYKDLENFYYRGNDQWLGVNPKSDNIISAMFSKANDYDAGVVRAMKPEQGNQYNRVFNRPYEQPINSPQRNMPSFQNGGRVSYNDWKVEHNLQETDNYNLQRAYELGYNPIDGHLPSVDDQTGDFLKLKGHPTLFKEIQQWHLNPELNKSIFPSMKEDGNLQYNPRMKNGGGVIKDNDGYWNPKNWGNVVEIDSNQITMKGVDQPLLGVSDTGDVQYMEPGREYSFNGKKVTEFPINSLSFNNSENALDMKKKIKKAQWGGNVMPNTDINLPTNIQGVSALPQQQSQGFNFNNFLNNNQQTIQQGASALGQGFGYGDQQQQGGPSVAQTAVGKFGPWGAAISAVSQMGTGITDQSRSNVVGALGTTAFDPGSIWTNPDLKGGKKIIGGILAPLGGYWAAQARNARRDQGERLDELLKDAQASVDQQDERRYVRPEDMVTTNNQMFPSYGTGTNILAKNGKTLPSYMNGNILPLWGGEAETLSHNPFLPGNGETVMFRGQSHDRSDGKGNTGIGINYGGNAIEVESGEPALQLKNGSSGNDNLVVYGNIKINDEFSSLLGDPDAKGKKFKSYVADLSEQEKKSAKILDKSTEKIDTMDVNTPYDKLKMSSMEANVLGSNMKLKSIADKKMNAAFLQQAINDDEEENKLKITDDGDVKKAKKGITQAQNGIVSDEDYDYLVGLYQKAMAQGEGDAVEFFQKEFSRLAPERAKSILANYPVTNYGKANNMTNAELQSNYDAIFGKRTRQYIPDKAREMSDLGITPIEEAGIMPGEKEVVTDINDPGYKRSALLDIFSQVAPYIRPSNAEGLDPRQLMGERFAIANNQLEPVQAQTYQPQLASPYEVSFQDTLNANRVDAAAAQRQYGYNPAAQSFLSAQQYQANQSVLGEQFRTNQALRDQVYTQNRNTLNDAQLKNLGIFDQQYQRQEQAKSNTKATAQGAISSIADKYLQNQLENRTLQTYENLYGYRFGNNMRAINMNAPYQFDIPTVGTVQDVDENGNVVVTNSEKTSTIRDAFGRPKGSRQTSETKSKKSYKNGSIVKEIHNL